MHFTSILSLVSLMSLAIASPTQHGRRYDPTNSTQMTSTTTTSSTTACPTAPEEGTYCGFINPEDPCAPQPSSAQGIKVVPDTVEAFSQFTLFQSMSLNATSAAGYTTIFKNLTSAAKTNSYLGFHLLDTYSTAACAAKCDETAACNSFNIYIERDPSVNPTKNDSTAPTVWGYWCPDPASITNYKCALYGDGVYTSSATNYGQHRGDFQVVIAGSNAYVKNAFYNTTTNQNGPSTTPDSASPSNVVQYTGAAGADAVAGLSVWGVVAFGLAVFMSL